MTEMEINFVLNQVMNAEKNPAIQNYLSELITYNLEGGKRIRYKAYLHCLKLLNHETTEDDYTIGWCIELLQAYLLITDDIADNSSMRRGQECWYIKKGMMAVKDASYMLSLLLKIVPPKHRNKVITLLTFVNFKTMLGQTQDTMAAITDPRIEEVRKIYNIKRYKQMVVAKTSYYSVYLPIALACVVSENQIPNNLMEFSDILGVYWQFRDDSENYQDKKKFKTSNDLEEKKASWYMSTIVDNIKDKSEELCFLEYIKHGEKEWVLKKVKELLNEYDKNDTMFLKKLRALQNSKEITEVYNYFVKLIQDATS